PPAPPRARTHRPWSTNSTAASRSTPSTWPSRPAAPRSGACTAASVPMRRGCIAPDRGWGIASAPTSARRRNRWPAWCATATGSSRARPRRRNHPCCGSAGGRNSCCSWPATRRPTALWPAARAPRARPHRSRNRCRPSAPPAARTGSRHSPAWAMRRHWAALRRCAPGATGRRGCCGRCWARARRWWPGSRWACCASGPVERDGGRRNVCLPYAPRGTMHVDAMQRTVTMTILRMTDLDLSGKRVLIRQDLNVPIDNGQITSEQRITASVPTLKLALEKGATVLVTSHLGRPKEGEWSEENSLAPVARRLGELLGRPVPLVRDWVDGVEVEPGGIVLLENCRMNVGEGKDSEELSKKYA